MKQSSGETRREDASPCQSFINSLVPRTQRSASWRCAAEPGPMQQQVRGLLGPGSAERHCVPHRVRDTRKTSVVATLRHCERSEAIQDLSAATVWIASLCSR
jgi:hypothetical protein